MTCKLFIAFATAALFAAPLAAQPQPVPTPPAAASEPTRNIALTDGELKATIDMINVCISANPAGCAEAGVIMRKKLEAAMKDTPAPTTPAVPARPPGPPNASGGAGAPQPPKQ